jgi:hypothetical protein
MSIETLPKVNWPTRAGNYKVIQVRIDAAHYMRFAKMDGIQHGAMLETLLTEARVPFIPKDPEKSTYPMRTGDRYELVGAGLFHTDGPSVPLFEEFKGKSAGYGIGIDREFALGFAEGREIRFND